jgi:molybdopterin/thiamine biosynthesis adenylyltransferase
VNSDIRDRYSRQIRLPSIGEEGQERLLASRALIIGVGGLGSPAALYLAAAGVGNLVLSDFDRVEPSNLQRQIIHRQRDIGEPKAFSGRATLHELNPACEVTAIDRQLDESELREQVAASDVVLDCCDNFETRFAVNRACVAEGKPLVSGAAIRLEGQVATFLPGSETSPCYQCLYPMALAQTETCAMEGVLAPVVGVIGSLQALQAVQVLTGNFEGLWGRLTLFDAATHEWRRVKVRRDPACQACGAVRA